MLMGLKEGQEKMSKSDVGSAIFMEDTAAEVTSKIKKAYCPPEVVENNPVMDYAKYIVIGYYGKIIINLSEGPVEYVDPAMLDADYLSGKIHPSQLKPAVTEALNAILEPVRRHFESGEPKALLEKVKKFAVTR